MNICVTCLHWTPPEPGKRLGACRRWLRGYLLEEMSVPDNEVWIEDDEGWGMRSGPEFGCVLWEKGVSP